MTTVNENTVEQAVLPWLSTLGWRVAHGADIALFYKQFGWRCNLT